MQVQVKPGKAPEPKASKPAADATGSTEQKDAPAPANEIVYDAGLQYQKGDITAALTTSKCIQQLNASLLYVCLESVCTVVDVVVVVMHVERVWG